MGEQVTDELVAMTMTPDAARAFWRALVWASGAADDAGRDEHYEWLSWGAGRLAAASPTSATGHDSGGSA